MTENQETREFAERAKQFTEAQMRVAVRLRSIMELGPSGIGIYYAMPDGSWGYENHGLTSALMTHSAAISDTIAKNMIMRDLNSVPQKENK